MTVTGMINMLLTEQVLITENIGETEIEVIKRRLDIVEKEIETLKQTKRK